MNTLKLFCINPPPVGGDRLEETTRKLYARIGEIITDSDLAQKVLPNSLNVSTAACLIFIVCTEDAMKTIRERLHSLSSLGDIRARVINDSLTAEDLKLYSTKAPQPEEKPSKTYNTLNRKIHESLHHYFGLCKDGNHTKPTTSPIRVVVILSKSVGEGEVEYLKKLEVLGEEVRTSTGFRFFYVTVTLDQIEDLAEQKWVDQIYLPWNGPTWG